MTSTRYAACLHYISDDPDDFCDVVVAEAIEDIDPAGEAPTFLNPVGTEVTDRVATTVPIADDHRQGDARDQADAILAGLGWDRTEDWWDYDGCWTAEVSREKGDRS